MANIRRRSSPTAARAAPPGDRHDRRPNYLALLNRNSYQKGGFVLHMLRAQVGDSAFFDALRALLREVPPRDGAVTDDLRAEMERSVAARSSAGSSTSGCDGRAIPKWRRRGRTTPRAGK